MIQESRLALSRPSDQKCSFTPTRWSPAAWSRRRRRRGRFWTRLVMRVEISSRSFMSKG